MGENAAENACSRAATRHATDPLRGDRGVSPAVSRTAVPNAVPLVGWENAEENTGSRPAVQYAADSLRGDRGILLAGSRTVVPEVVPRLRRPGEGVATGNVARPVDSFSGLQHFIPGVVLIFVRGIQKC